MASTDSTTPGNFAHDREKAAEAGRKGGEHSQSGQGTTHSNSGSHSAGSQSAGSQSAGSAGKSGHSNPGNFANDREKAAEAGRKGGQTSHSGR